MYAEMKRKNKDLKKVIAEKNKELEKVKEMKEKLKEKCYDLFVSEDTVSALINKERQSSDELWETHSILMEVFLQELRESSGESFTIGVKRMGEIDEKPFIEACKKKFNVEDAGMESAKLCSLWQDRFMDQTWHPFKLVREGENIREVVNEEDEKLKKLRNDWGHEVMNSVKKALEEINEFNPSGRFVVSKLWNFKQNKKATLKEGIAQLALHLIKTRKIQKSMSNCKRICVRNL